MTIYQRAVQVLASLSAEEEQSSSSELLDRGVVVASQLDQAASTLVRAHELAVQLSVSPPRADVKAMTKALAGLEQGLSKWGVKAFQHKSTSTAIDEAKNLVRVVERWGLSAWKTSLNDLVSTIDTAIAPDLLGGAGAVLKVQLSGKRLSAALALNPLTDLDRLKANFECDDLGQVLERLRERASNLEQALGELKAQHEAMSDGIRAALASAQTAGGLPLSSVTHELLDELRIAGVIDRLTVRPG